MELVWCVPTDLYTEGGDALDLARREEREYREYLSDE